MPFIIPNRDDVPFQDQAEPDSVDFDIMRDAFDGTGVISGCAVTFNSPAATLTVDVAAGTVQVDGTSVGVGAGTETVAAGDGSNPRFDLIAADNLGATSVVAGVAASNPVFPAIPGNSVILAAIYIPAGFTDLDDEPGGNGNNLIVDKRVINRLPSSGASFNVLDYGAIGDGATDDTAAIQSALDAADTAGGGTVFFPANVYRIIADLVINTNTQVRGEGFASIVRQDTADEDGFTLTAGDDRMAVRDIHIQSNVTSPSRAGSAIRMDSNRESYVSNVWIDGDVQQTDRWRYGIELRDGASNSNWLFFQNFYIQSIDDGSDSAGIFIDRNLAGWGYNFLGGVVQTEEDTSGSNYTTPGYCGLRIQSVDGCHFSDIEFIAFEFPCIIEQAGNDNFVLITNSKFKSISFEAPGDGNPAVDIRTNGGTNAGVISSVSFYGCTIFGAGGTNSDGLRIDAADASPGDVIQDIHFSDCYFTANGTGNSVTMTSGSGASVIRIRFSNCHMPSGADSVEINADVAGPIVLIGCDISSGVDINGSDNKEVQILACDLGAATVDLAGNSGSQDEIDSAHNIPKAGNSALTLLGMFFGNDFFATLGSPVLGAHGAGREQYQAWALDQGASEAVALVGGILLPPNFIDGELEFRIQFAPSNSPTAGNDVDWAVGTPDVEDIPLGASFDFTVETDGATFTFDDTEDIDERQEQIITTTSANNFQAGNFVRFYIERVGADDSYNQDVWLVAVGVYGNVRHS